MNKDVLSRNNHLFFYVALAIAVMEEDFESIVRSLAARSRSTMLDEKDRFETMTFLLSNGEVGYFQIGKASADNLYKLKASWWNRIPQSIGGEVNNRCFIADEGGYDITIQIIGYETRDGLVSNHNELEDISDETPLGVVVSVYVTPTGCAIPTEEMFCVWDDENRMQYIPF